MSTEAKATQPLSHFQTVLLVSELRRRRCYPDGVEGNPQMLADINAQGIARWQRGRKIWQLTQIVALFLAVAFCGFVAGWQAKPRHVVIQYGPNPVTGEYAEPLWPASPPEPPPPPPAAKGRP